MLRRWRSCLLGLLIPLGERTVARGYGDSGAIWCVLRFSYDGSVWWPVVVVSPFTILRKR